MSFADEFDEEGYGYDPDDADECDQRESLFDPCFFDRDLDHTGCNGFGVDFGPMPEKLKQRIKEGLDCIFLVLVMSPTIAVFVS